MSISDSNINYPALEKNLFGAVHKGCGYGIEFEKSGTFSFLTGEFGWDVIIFGVDMNSSCKCWSQERRYFNC